jgi:hypothetical protein
MLSHFAIQLDLDTAGFEPQPIQIPGLTYIPEYILPEEQSQLLDLIDRHPWSKLW